MDLGIKLEFEQELLNELAEIPVTELEPNSVILLEHTYIKEIPILLEGSIKVRKNDESGKEIILYKIEPGESCILSLTSLLNNKYCNAEAYVETKSKVILIPSETVKKWVNKYDSWRQYVSKLYYDRFEELLELIDSIAFKQVDIRLLKKLKEHQQKEGNIIKITHQGLAKEIGTAREVISRLLKQLERKSIIKLDRGTIKIMKDL
jgi:CRP/FNR family transcriptional regulator, anaerobic regulatory protein